MKKIILITLVLFMVVLSACGKQSQTKEPTDSTSTTDSITDNTNTEDTQTESDTTSDGTGTGTETGSDTTETDIPDLTKRAELRLVIDDQNRNINRNGFVFSHNGYEGSNIPQYLIDGKATTKWGSTPTTRNDDSQSHWVVIELDKVYDFNTYTIMGAGSHGSDQAKDVPSRNPRAFEVYVSLDNKTWTLVDAVKDNVKSDLSIYVGPQKAKYVKLNITQGDQGGSTKSHYARIYEFQLYNLDKSVYEPLLPRKQENVKVEPKGKYLAVGTQIYCSSIDVISDFPFTIQITTDTSKYTEAFISEWYFIVDGKKVSYKNQVSLFDNDKTAIMSIPSLPLKANSENEIIIQMGDKYYTKFKYTPTRTTLGWVYAGYERNSISIKFTELPNIKVMDTFNVRQGNNPHATTLIVMTIDENEKYIYCHVTESLGRGNNISIEFPNGNLDFYIPHDTTNDTMNFEKGTLIGGIPTLYIELAEDRHVDNIPHGTYVNASYSIYSGGDYPDIVDQPLEIKGRGNYSWGVSNKKPYTLKLGEKRGLLGMGRTKRWVLINSYTDKTQIRNFLTLKTGPQMGLDNTTECRYVNVVVNGDYRGIYVLTQKIEIDPNVVDVDEERGALFEIEMEYRHGNHNDCIVLESGTHILLKTPDLEDLTELEKEQVLSLFRIRLAIFDNALTKGYAEFSKYIDVDSFINWYILNEFTKNYDSAFVTSCYFYYNPDDMKFYMGPLWDYDTCYGSQGNNPPDGFRVRDVAPWYILMFKDKTFERMVKERYTDLRYNGLIEWMTDCVYDAAIYLTDSLALEFTRWPGEMTLRDMRGDRTIYEYSGEVIALVDWIRERANWLDSHYFIRR